MANPLNKKSNKERAEEENDIISIDEAAKETIDKISRDVGKSAAIKQLAIGSLSGWCTGFISIKVGKIAALAVGGSIVLLQIANHQGYIKINWDKVADKVEEKATGRSPKWMEKVERYVDRKVDKAEEELRRREHKARRWYHTFVNGEEPFQFKEIHIFVASFAAGLALGIISG